MLPIVSLFPRLCVSVNVNIQKVKGNFRGYGMGSGHTHYIRIPLYNAYFINKNGRDFHKAHGAERKECAEKERYLAKKSI